MAKKPKQVFISVSFSPSRPDQVTLLADLEHALASGKHGRTRAAVVRAALRHLLRPRKQNPGTHS